MIALPFLLVPLMMALVYLAGQRLRGDAWFGVFAVLGIAPVVILMNSRLLTAWWHVVLAAVGAGLVAGVLYLPLLLCSDLRKAIERLGQQEEQTASRDKG
jgi:cellobiose-specific phosphotransferase system component IIC